MFGISSLIFHIFESVSSNPAMDSCGLAWFLAGRQFKISNPLLGKCLAENPNLISMHMHVGSVLVVSFLSLIVDLINYFLLQLMIQLVPSVR